MKILQIAIKDMKQALHSFMAIAMMFGMPLLITGMFALVFGGSSGEDASGFDIEAIPVALANEDQGTMGGTLSEILSGDNFAGILDVSVVNTVDEARAAVDDGQAQVAVIIPVDFSASLYTPGAASEVEIYSDPTLTLGPGIVDGIVRQLVDGFSGSTIAIGVASQQFAQNGQVLSGEQMMTIANQYRQAMQTISAGQGGLVVEAAGKAAPENQGVAGMMAMVMAGMMVFYTFYTGTTSANSLLTEEDNQTLARMLTTATTPVEIIAGKLTAGALMVLVQSAVLMAFGHFVFGIQWGSLWMLVLFVVGLTIGAVTFGLFAISWAKDRKQASLIVGGGVTLTGMLGMSSIFMMNAPSQSLSSLSLLVPQGWANQMVLQIMENAPVHAVLISLLGLLVYSVVLFAIGTRRFMKRFA